MNRSHIPFRRFIPKRKNNQRRRCSHPNVYDSDSEESSLIVPLLNHHNCNRTTTMSDHHNTSISTIVQQPIDDRVDIGNNGTGSSSSISSSSAMSDRHGKKAKKKITATISPNQTSRNHPTISQTTSKTVRDIDKILGVDTTGILSSSSSASSTSSSIRYNKKRNHRPTSQIKRPNNKKYLYEGRYVTLGKVLKSYPSKREHVMCNDEIHPPTIYYTDATLYPIPEDSNICKVGTCCTVSIFQPF